MEVTDTAVVVHSAISYDIDDTKGGINLPTVQVVLVVSMLRQKDRCVRTDHNNMIRPDVLVIGAKDRTADRSLPIT